MLFSRHHLAALLICAYTFTSLPTLSIANPLKATVSHVGTTKKTFLGEPIGNFNALGQKLLKIDKVLSPDGPIQIAISTFTAEKTKEPTKTLTKCIRYVDDNGQNIPLTLKLIKNERTAYAYLDKADMKLKGAAADGKHLSVRRLHEFSIGKKHICFVMTYAGDTPLGEYTVFMPPKEKAIILPQILREILRGLAYMHRAGLAHNDIKPDNIMVFQLPTGGFGLKIIDYDLVVPLKKNIFRKLKYMTNNSGSLEYISPEAVMKMPCDLRKKDTWGAAMTIYTLLFNRYLFEEEKSKFANKLIELRNLGWDLSIEIPLTYNVDADTKMGLESLVRTLILLLKPKFEDRYTPEKFLMQKRVN
ncbi:kinase-like domain-containing protein [Syncephalis fuscata]|nr:kinase-like domain-containing protein [Syncephalis fuscata]